LPDQRVNPQGWGQQPLQAPSAQPPAQPPKQRSTPSPPPHHGRPPQWGPPNPNPLWQRKGFWVVAGSIGALLLVVGLLSEPDRAATPTAATASTAAPTTSAPPSAPTTTAPPPTTVRTATVPSLVGMKTGQAKTALSRRGLHWTIKYKSTSRLAPGTVISQSSTAGAEVRAGASVALVIAKAPPPPLTTAPVPPTTAAPRNCLGSRGRRNTACC
jgi:hypothetical protein